MFSWNSLKDLFHFITLFASIFLKRFIYYLLKGLFHFTQAIFRSFSWFQLCWNIQVPAVVRLLGSRADIVLIIKCVFTLMSKHLGLVAWLGSWDKLGKGKLENKIFVICWGRDQRGKGDCTGVLLQSRIWDGGLNLEEQKERCGPTVSQSALLCYSLVVSHLNTKYLIHNLFSNSSEGSTPYSFMNSVSFLFYHVCFETQTGW